MRSVLRSIGFGRKKVPVKSPIDDSTTRPTTTAHSSMTREPQKDPKNAVKFSPNETAARNALQYSLEFLGKTPVPGIGAVTDVLLHVVKGIQVRVSLDSVNT